MIYKKMLIISIIILNLKLRDFIKSYSKGAVASFFLEVFLHLDVVLTYLVDKVGNKKLHPTKTSLIALRSSLLKYHS